MKSPVLQSALLASTLAWMFPCTVSARGQELQSLGPPTRLTEINVGAYRGYGFGLGGWDDTLVVGAPEALPNVFVDVYVRAGSDWVRQAQILSPDPPVPFESSSFGDQIAGAGDTLVIGAYGHLSAAGSVYVFQRSAGQWTYQSRLRANDPTGGARFGQSLGFDGSTLAVGAPGINAVYVFVHGVDGWQQQQRIILPGAAQNDRFGHAVRIDGERLVIGAPGRGPVTNQGAIFVFNRQGGTWTLEASLQRIGANASDQLGTAVAIQGGVIAAGAPFAEAGGPDNAGAVLTWRREGGSWMLLSELSNPEASFNARLGASLSMLGPRLLAGSPGDRVAGNVARGSAVLFLQDEDGWELRERLIAAEGAPLDEYGWAVALGTNLAAVTAPGMTIDSQEAAGAAYAYISRASQTTLSGIPASVRIGQPFPITATVETIEVSPTGSVRVRDDLGAECSIALLDGSGTCQLVAGQVGPRQLRARYEGAPGVSESFGEGSVQVVPDLSITPPTLPRAQIGRSYVASFGSPATGATAPLNWSLASGGLPPGVTLAPGGNLSGTPSAFGSFSFAVTVTDSSGAALGGPFSESRAYTLEVDPPFTTRLTLLDPVSEGDRGPSRAFTAELDVVEDGASAPNGNFAVSASNGGSVLSCSAPVSNVGPQTCSIAFGPGVAVGDYAISAVFVSSSAGMAGSSASGSHRLFSPADPAVSVESLDPIYLPEQPLRHRIRVENLGPDTAFQISLGGSLTPSIGDLQWTCSGAACPAASGSGLPNLVIAALPAAAAVEFTVVGTLGETVPAQLTLAASVNLLPAGFSRELDADNNGGSAVSLPARLFRDGFESPEPP